MKRNELKLYLTKFHSLVNSGFLNQEKITDKVVIDYYSRSAFYYRKFHSSKGAMHLPVSFNSIDNHNKKLQYQAQRVEDFINEKQCSRILELGCGMGFNTNYLARNCPKASFEAIDLNERNLSFAKEQAKELENVTFRQASFDEPFNEEGKYDLIFAVETLCHSQNLDLVLQRMAEKLNDNGRIIIYDGYIKDKSLILSNDIDYQAYKLLTWGFALNEFQNLKEVTELKSTTCLDLEYVTEYTNNVLPNLMTFQNGAKKALRFPLILKLLLKTKILPLELIKQLGAGLVSPYFLKKDYMGYFELRFQKTLLNNC